MGYTTEFEGRFDCYRPEGKEMGAFLRAASEGDPTAAALLGDWLTDRGDPRGEQVSAALAGGSRDLTIFWQLFGLRPEHAAYLRQFSETRRMRRDPDRAALVPDPVRQAAGLPLGKEAAYFVGGRGFMGQDEDDSVLDANKPPSGQPGLWCQWVPTADRAALEWNGAEKFYHYVEWLEYLIEHFLAPWGYVLNGTVTWQGEEAEDRGTITVVDNRVDARASAGGP